MQQVPVEMFGNRSALTMDFERDGGAAQAVQSATHCNWILDEIWRTSGYVGDGLIFYAASRHPPRPDKLLKRTRQQPI
jgi:hypothetical protein